MAMIPSLIQSMQLCRLPTFLVKGMGGGGNPLHPNEMCRVEGVDMVRLYGVIHMHFARSRALPLPEEPKRSEPSGSVELEDLDDDLAAALALSMEAK